MKHAVVLGGGGSRGSYQAGVWKALQELGYRYDIVCGTSVGSLNAALMAQGDMDAAVELWNRITTGDVLNMKGEVDLSTPTGQRRLLGEFIDRFVREGGVDPAPLEALLREVIDEDKIRRSPVEFGLVTVEYPTMKPLVITKENIPEGQLCDYLMASSACYPAMKSRHIADKRYIDGGYYSNLPIEIALERGADEIVAVDLAAIGIVRPVKHPGKRVITIRSRWDLGVFLVFEPKTAGRNMALGYNDTMKAFGRMEGEWYTFHPGQSERNRDRVLGGLRSLTMRVYYKADETDKGRFLRGLAQEALRRVMGGRPGLQTPQTFRGWAEAAGRVLDIDPTPAYNFDEFNALVAEAAARLPDLPPAAAQALGALKGDTASIQWLSRLDRKAVMAYLCALLRELDQTKTGGERLSLLAALLPEEFMGALYIYALGAIEEETK